MFSQLYRDVADRKEPLIIGAIAGMMIIMIATAGLVPNLLGNPLEPPVMINHVLGLQKNSLVGWAGHLLVGLVLFPLGYMLLAYRHFPGPALLKGVLYALILGTVAGLAAPLTGNELFMGSHHGALSLYQLHGAYCILIALIVGRPSTAVQGEEGRLTAHNSPHAHAG